MKKRKRGEYRFHQRDLSAWTAIIAGLLMMLVMVGGRMLDIRLALDNDNVAGAAIASHDSHCNISEDVLIEKATQGGVLSLDCSAPYTITLTQPLNITADVMIRGNDLTTITGRDTLETMFRVTDGASLTLRDLHITDSSRYGIYLEPGTMLHATNISLSEHGSDSADGAAIWNDGGYVYIGQSMIEDNHSHDEAAGILNWRDGVAKIRAVSFRNNSAGIESDGMGAAILNYGTLTVKNSSFVNNQTPNSTGAAIASLDGTALIQETDFMNNTASTDGAAIYNGTTSEMTLLDNTFTGNSANCENHGTVNDLTICPVIED